MDITDTLQNPLQAAFEMPSAGDRPATTASASFDTVRVVPQEIINEEDIQPGPGHEEAGYGYGV